MGSRLMAVLCEFFFVFHSSIQESAHAQVSVCAYYLVSTPTILARWAPVRKKELLLLKSTQFHLFRRHKSDTAHKKFHSCFHSTYSVPESSGISFLTCRKEGYFRKKIKRQNPQPKLSKLFNGIHPTGQEFPYRSGKKKYHLLF